MENQRNLFELQLGEFAKAQLRDTAKWARFLAVVGFIGIGLFVCITAIVAIATADVSTGNDEPGYRAGVITGSILGPLIVGVIYFFPCLFLYRFSRRMDAALVSDDINSLNESLRNLKMTFRYMGVVTIIFIGLFALGMLANLGNA